MLASVSKDKRKQQSLDEVVASTNGNKDARIAVLITVIAIKQQQLQQKRYA